MPTRLHILFVILFFISFKMNATSVPNRSIPENIIPSDFNQNVVKLFYSNGQIQITGLVMGTGDIIIYSIIGNKITEFTNIQLADFKKPIILESGSMYIVKIKSDTTIKTYKLIAN